MYCASHRSSSTHFNCPPKLPQIKQEAQKKAYREMYLSDGYGTSKKIELFGNEIKERNSIKFEYPQGLDMGNLEITRPQKNENSKIRK